MLLKVEVTPAVVHIFGRGIFRINLAIIIKALATVVKRFAILANLAI